MISPTLVWLYKAIALNVTLSTLNYAPSVNEDTTWSIMNALKAINVLKNVVNALIIINAVDVILVMFSIRVFA